MTVDTILGCIQVMLCIVVVITLIVALVYAIRLLGALKQMRKRLEPTKQHITENVQMLETIQQRVVAIETTPLFGYARGRKRPQTFYYKVGAKARQKQMKLSQRKKRKQQRKVRKKYGK